VVIVIDSGCFDQKKMGHRGGKREMGDVVLL